MRTEVLSNDIQLETRLQLARPITKQLRGTLDVKVPNLIESFWRVLAKYLFEKSVIDLGPTIK
jgi:hypothetical protein